MASSMGTVRMRTNQVGADRESSKLKSPLSILQLEDDPNDAALIQSALAEIICLITRVQTRDDSLATLERGGIDLILSDFDLPSFDGLSAAEIVRTQWFTTHLVLVSGSLDEDLTIDSFKIGATDCVPKRDLSRLAPAVRRAMREVEQGIEQLRLEAQVTESQKLELISQLSSGVAHDAKAKAIGSVP
jgi:CheY-like chemotaxis protein